MSLFKKLPFLFALIAWVAIVFGLMLRFIPMPFAEWMLVFGFGGMALSMAAIILRRANA